MSAEQNFIDTVVREIMSRNIGIQLIYDIGAHDLDESIALHNEFPIAHIVAFEANPEMWELCESKQTDKIKFIPTAISDVNGTMTFNITTGAKQCSAYTPVNSDTIKKVVNVPVARLDIYPAPDLIFMDIQAGEYKALLGLGDKLNQVKVIATELFVNHGEYVDAPGFDEVDELLKDRFELIAGDPFQGNFDNFIYIRRDLL